MYFKAAFPLPTASSFGKALRISDNLEITTFYKVFTRISSCQVNTTSRQGITQLGISFGSIFPLLSNESSRGPHSL